MEIATIGLVLSGMGIVLTLIWNIYSASRNKTQDQLSNERRLVVLETKIGLFWGLVEEHLPRLLHNPWSDNERNALNVYMAVGASRTPTEQLRVLEAGIEYKLKTEKLEAGDVVAFAAVLAAIKAQLIDRGEPVKLNTLR